jgi:hypothetical protein
MKSTDTVFVDMTSEQRHEVYDCILVQGHVNCGKEQMTG